MNLDLIDEETAAPLAELDRIIEGDRYPFSPRIGLLKQIRDKIRPYPVARPWWTQLVEPPRARRRGRG
jgi:hypothetical protein